MHKQNIPLRPIISNIQSPTYHLSKYLINLLKIIVGRKDSFIKDPWTFHEFITKVNIPDNNILVSFYVISLFTNIPINLTINIIKEKWDDLKDFKQK